MLCKRCQQELSESTQEHGERPRGEAPSSGPDLTDLKARYADLLENVDSVEQMMAKLSQLSRFGLGAEDQPILTSFANEGGDESMPRVLGEQGQEPWGRRSR